MVYRKTKAVEGIKFDNRTGIKRGKIVVRITEDEFGSKSMSFSDELMDDIIMIQIRLDQLENILEIKR